MTAASARFRGVSARRAGAPLARMSMLGLTLLALLAVPAAALGDQGANTTWAIAPAADGNADDGGRISLRMQVEPGEDATDAVTVTNYSSQPATFVVYASDGVITEEGQFDILPAQAEAAEAGSWITIGEDTDPGEPVTVEIDAESDVTLPVQISVPDEVTPGDHPAGIVAALANEAGGVGMETRVGTRVHLRVAGELAPALTISDIDTQYQSSFNPFAPGELEVSYEVENTGNVRLGAQSTVAGSSLFGLGERSGPGAEAREILPGESAHGMATLENVWPLARFNGEITTVPVVVGDDVIDVALDEAATDFHAWTIPWLYVIAIAALLVLVFSWRRLRKRREAQTQARIEAAIAAKTEDTSPGDHASRATTEPPASATEADTSQPRPTQPTGSP